MINYDDNFLKLSNWGFGYFKKKGIGNLIPYDDLRQLINLGLCQAYNTYKEDKGTAFHIYAFVCMKNEVYQGIRNSKSLFSDTKYASIDELEYDTFERQATTKIPRHEYNQLQVETSVDVEQIVEDKLLLEKTLDIINQLPYPQKNIMLRHFIEGEQIQDIAKSLGISRQRVSIYKDRALTTLRRKLL